MRPEDFRRIRERLGLSQAAFADLLRLSSQNIIGRYERGTRVPAGPTIVLYRLLDQGVLDTDDLRLLDWLP